MAAHVPAVTLNAVLTDADWVQDFEFTDDGVPHDFGASTFSLAVVPVSASAAAAGFILDTAGGTLELQGARVCVRVPAADMGERRVGDYRWELREHREDDGVIALAFGEVTINAGLSASVDGVPVVRSRPVAGLGGTVVINTPPGGPVQVARGVGGPVGRSALQHLIANGSLSVGATEADFEEWLRQQAEEAIAKFTQTVASPATVWTVNHNLGSRPHVTTLDTSGAVMWGEVEHLSDNTVRITFLAPVAGAVRCI